MNRLINHQFAKPTNNASSTVWLHSVSTRECTDMKKQKILFVRRTFTVTKLHWQNGHKDEVWCTCIIETEKKRWEMNTSLHAETRQSSRQHWSPAPFDSSYSIYTRFDSLLYTYFTLPCRAHGLVGLALDLVDWPTVVLQCLTLLVGSSDP